MSQNRNVATCIVLSIITCGIYTLYWWVKVTDDVSLVTNRPGTSGGVALLLSIITCGIYGLYWAWTMGEKLDAARADHGIAPGSFSIVFLLLNLFGLGIITLALIQSELNKYTPKL